MCPSAAAYFLVAFPAVSCHFPSHPPPPPDPLSPQPPWTTTRIASKWSHRPPCFDTTTVTPPSLIT